jgi:hypothetical protein
MFGLCSLFIDFLYFSKAFKFYIYSIQVSSRTEGSNTLVRRNPSITSISNFNKEDGFKGDNHEAKSTKKVDFLVDKDPNDSNLLKKN